MNILLSVCGRAGSKGVKNKNSREFLGWPLVLYTLSALALFKKNYSGNFNSIDISVNSDSRELLDIAGKTGLCTLIERPAELALDTSPKIPVMRYSLFEMEKRHNKIYELLVDLDITAPLRTVKDIMNLIGITLNADYEVAFSVVHSRRNPYFNMVEEHDNKIFRVKDTDFTYRQQAPEVYDMNASIYSFKRDFLLKGNNNILESRCGLYLMKDTAVLDIDREDDFTLMEILAEHYFFKLAEYDEIRKNIPDIYQK
jgi:CMP-N,N'-diacetyllegionaminic acid synthase